MSRIEAGQQRRECGEDEEQPDEDGDGAGAATDDGAQADGENAEEPEVEADADDGPQRPGGTQADPAVAENGLADEEREQADDGSDGERGDAEDDRFGGDDRAPLGGGGERGADHPGRVFAGHGEHAQHPEGDLGEHEPADGG